MKKNYICIDYLKLFFCFCVVAIHSEIFFNFDNNFDFLIYHGLFRQAVPFFFVATGFFLGIKLFKLNDLNEKNKVINKYIKRLLVPYIFWLLVSSYGVFIKFDGSLIIRILKFFRMVLLSPWSALWYIWATIIFLLIYKLLINVTKDKLNHKVLLIISLVLYVFALLCNNYYFVIENTFIGKIVDLYLKVFVTARNGVFVSLFLVIGLLFAKYQNKINNISRKKIGILTFISLVLLFIEVYLTKNCNFMDDRSLYISFIFYIPLLFMLASSYTSNKDSSMCRNLSTGIYFTHCVTIHYLKFILTNNYIIYIATIAIDIVILLILYKINNKYINKVIK